MSDTPRTDAQDPEGEWGSVDANFARNLERELASCNEALADARAELAEWSKKAEAWFASPEAAQRLEGYRELGARAAAAENERDRLRAQLERAMQAIAKIAAARDAVSGKPMYAPEMTRLLMAIEDARQLEAGR